ncbi:MAG: glycosyltransferase [Anaerolineales bacterium]
MTESLLEKTKLLEAAPILILPVRITPRKNIELALNTLAALNSRDFPQAALVVTGRWVRTMGTMSNILKCSPVSAQATRKVRRIFLAELHDGFLPDEVIADFYRVADALFFPSREEGFGIPLIEAAFSHLPAFCADIPPLKKLGGEDAVFFSPDEKPETVAKLIVSHFQASLPARLAIRARLSRFVGKRSIVNISRHYFVRQGSPCQLAVLFDAQTQK